jgi:IPT/TIG domain.
MRRSQKSLVLVAAALVVSALSACTSTGAPAAQRSAVPAQAGQQQNAAVRQVTPNTASVIATPTVTIRGTALASVTSVRFGTQVVPVKKATSTMVTVTAPAAMDYQPATVELTLLDKDGKTVAAVPNGYRNASAPGVASQMQYALAHWKSYNTSQYGDLNPLGGDCANFASQTLVARGWSMNADWYNHDAAASWSPSWGYVPAFDDYMAQNASKLGLEKLSFSQADRAKVALGDIGVFEWANDGYRDHIEIVDKITHVNGKILISFASHNDDYAFRDLDTTITKQHPGAGGHIWHLTR